MPTESEFKSALKEELGREPTEKEMNEFKAQTKTLINAEGD